MIGLGGIDSRRQRRAVKDLTSNHTTSLSIACRFTKEGYLDQVSIVVSVDQAGLRETKERLTRLAGLMIEERVEEGVFLGTRHYSSIASAC